MKVFVRLSCFASLLAFWITVRVLSMAWLVGCMVWLVGMVGFVGSVGWAGWVGWLGCNIRRRVVMTFINCCSEWSLFAAPLICHLSGGDAYMFFKWG